MCLTPLYMPRPFIHTAMELVSCAGMGIIAQVGGGVSGWKEGQRVTAAPWTYAEQVILHVSAYAQADLLTSCSHAHASLYKGMHHNRRAQVRWDVPEKLVAVQGHGTWQEYALVKAEHLVSARSPMHGVACAPACCTFVCRLPLQDPVYTAVLGANALLHQHQRLTASTQSAKTPSLFSLVK